VTRTVPFPQRSDGVVRLRPLEPEDAAAHLAGEDVELRRWLSGGPSTIDTVNSLIARSTASWQTAGPMRNFGIWEEASGALAGNCEANSAAESIGPGEANISYAIWPRYRGRGFATRAVELLCAYLREATDWRRAIIRVEPANTRSLAVARRAGFVEIPSSEPKFVRLARPLR